jgi:hypothetical protein
MYLPEPPVDFELPPAGTHIGICTRVIDLGTQASQYGEKHKIRLVWELQEELSGNGKPYLISRSYSWSMHPKSTLRHDLEAWRGVPFITKDFGASGFDIRNILGKACLLTIGHEPNSEGQLRANVNGVSKLMKGQTVSSLVNPLVYVWLSPDRFDSAAFESLHEKTRETIAKSPEYQAIASGKPIAPPAASAAAHDDDLADPIPF